MAPLPSNACKIAFDWGIPSFALPPTSTLANNIAWRAQSRQQGIQPEAEHQESNLQPRPQERAQQKQAVHRRGRTGIALALGRLCRSGSIRSPPNSSLGSFRSRNLLGRSPRTTQPTSGEFFLPQWRMGCNGGSSRQDLVHNHRRGMYNLQWATKELHVVHAH